ncbi:MAG: hypothetical protein ABII26_12165 [Pseudomonadota bacterium]
MRDRPLVILKMRSFFLFIILMILFGLNLPHEGYGGTIGTGILCRPTVEGPGKIGLGVEILNTGNETAYNMTATIFLAEWFYRYDDLGDNPPHGRIPLNIQYHNPKMKPGSYVGVIRVSFEEQGGRPHTVYYFFEVSHLLDQADDYKPHMTLRLTTPLFNTKALWVSGGKSRLFMRNDHTGILRPTVIFYLPDGFTTREPERLYELSPGQERGDTIPLIRDPSVRQDQIYHVVAWYEHKGVHYSHHIEGQIKVVERPFLFKAYVIMCIGILVIVFLILFFYDRKKKGRN